MTKKITAAVALLFAGNAAAEIVIEHAALITAGTEYHSNLQYLEREAQSVYLYSLVPEYKVKALDGRNQWYGQLGIALERSSNKTVSGRREDPFAKVGWKRQLEKGTLGIEASYIEESARDTQLAETGLVFEDSTSTTRAFVVDWTRELTAKLGLIMQAGYEDNKFSGSEALQGFDVRNVKGELNYKLNETVTPFVRLGATDYRSIDRTKFQELLTGATVTFSPKLKVQAGLGVTHISTTGENEGVGFLKAGYSLQKSKFQLELAREVFPTATNLVELGDQLTATYDYALSEKSRLGSELILSQNNSGQENQGLAGFYERDLTRLWQMRLQLGVNNIKTEEQRSTNNNTVGINFTYRTPKF